MTENVQTVTADAALEKRVIRKLTFRLIPFLMLLYFIAYLDRVNVGFAKLTMNDDIGLSAAAYGFGAGIFFIGYFLFEVPSNLFLHKVGARRWIARIMLTWGLISGGMAFVTNPMGFYILRFLLGAAEAGFFPGIIFYISFWFPAAYRARITAMFMAAVPISIALGSPISGALLQMDGILGFRGWQWLFIIEAAPAVILAFVTLKFLTDRPADAKWLSVEEKSWLKEKLDSEDKGKTSAHTIGAALKALIDPRVLVLGLIYFGTSAGLYTLGIWAPSIIQEQGLSSFATGWVNSIPPIFAVVGMILWARHSDKMMERRWHVFLACGLAAAGLVYASFAMSIYSVVLALVLVNVGVSAAKPPLWTIPTKFLTGASAAAGIAAVNSIGNLGGFAGPYMIGVIKGETGDYAGGLYFVAALLALSAALVLFTDNRKQKLDQS